MSKIFNYKSNEQTFDVHEDHLKFAVKVKKELQKSSPSHRCDWNKLIKIMNEEGYTGATKCEEYRKLVLYYQSKYYEEEVETNTLTESIGELFQTKKEVQIENRKLNKIKNELGLFEIVAEKIKAGIENFDKVEFKREYVKDKNDGKLLLGLSDWHIGLKNESYNYEEAKKRIEKVYNFVMNKCSREGIKTVYIAGMGDLVENVYMRSTQAYEVEFDFAEQINRSTELVLSLIEKISEKYNVVYLGIVAGNHDRMFIKGQTIVNDSAMKIVDYTIEKIINKSKSERVVVDKSGYNGLSIKYKINGHSFKIIHGDKESKNNLNKVKSHISTDSTFYDFILYGHFHRYDVTEENNGRMAIGFGCMQGSTDYSIDLGYNSRASQGCVVFKNGEFTPYRIKL